MGKMLPIPASIIRSARTSGSSGTNSTYLHRRFIIKASIYFAVTASLCYLFLFALVTSNVEKSEKHPQIRKRSASGVNLLLWLAKSNNNSEKGNQNQESEGKRQEAIEDYNYHHQHHQNKALNLQASSSAKLQSELHQLSPHRKILHSLRKAKRKQLQNKNGAWRSNSTQIWSGHQDLDQQHQHIIEEGLNRRKTSRQTEVNFYPWRKDEQCKSFKVQFAEKGTFKPRALVSFPGSGNSWLRYLIESASGYFTGSVYNDSGLFKSGLMGELRPANDGSTILQKTHHDIVGKHIWKLSKLIFDYRGVLLIRNPYDALISFRNTNTIGDTKNKNRHTEFASRSVFIGRPWVKFVTRNIRRWTALIMTWIENSQDYLIVLYEDLHKNPRKELIRILKHLNQTVDTKRLDCLMKPEHVEGPFHRVHPTTTALPNKTLAVSDKSLLDWFPSTITSTLITSSQQDKNIRINGELPSTHHYHQDQHEHQDQQTLFVLDSKKSQRDQQQHFQSPSQTITAMATAQLRRKSEEEEEEQKEDKFLLLPPSSSQMIFSTPSQQHQQQNQDTTSSRMMSRTISISNDNHHDRNNNNHNNNHQQLNKSSILRLDLIIQDNIDKINRFFQQKSIPLQLLYSLRPSIASYYHLSILK